MIRVFAIVKSAVFISAIQPYLLENGIDLIAICQNPSAALVAYSKTEADIVLLDVHWNRDYHSISFNQLLDNLIEYQSGIKIILVSNAFEPTIDTIKKCKNIRGYFYHAMNNAFTNIIKCFSDVHCGREYFATA
jgi:DNA-binding NarL/FixJ family response regulator